MGTVKITMTPKARASILRLGEKINAALDSARADFIKSVAMRARTPADLDFTFNPKTQSWELRDDGR